LRRRIPLRRRLDAARLVEEQAARFGVLGPRVPVCGDGVAGDRAAAAERELDPVLGDESGLSVAGNCVALGLRRRAGTANDDPVLLVRGKNVAADRALGGAADRLAVQV